MKVNIGKNTIGDNDKMSVSLREYERSTHDLSHAWRSTMGVGTLVPALKILALPGDIFDIDINQIILTNPTIGPLFGTFKLQVDIFTCPLRLYNAMLHNNALNIGMEMSKVKLPKIHLTPQDDIQNDERIFSDCSSSSLLNYLGLAGVKTDEKFQCCAYLGYWDILKNYYANKQEKKFPILIGEKGEKYFSSGMNAHVYSSAGGNGAEFYGKGFEIFVVVNSEEEFNWKGKSIVIEKGLKTNVILDPNKFIDDQARNNTTTRIEKFGDGSVKYSIVAYDATQNVRYTTSSATGLDDNEIIDDNNSYIEYGIAGIEWFDLEDIDQLRMDILSKGNLEFVIEENPNGKFYEKIISKVYRKNALAGLALKTHFSDLFNNWVSDEWVNGENGISAITAISTANGSFTIDTLNLSQKVYNMLNRIAVSGGTYKDWIETVYTTDYYFRAETPVYEGGLSAQIDFQEVVSTAQTEGKPIGTLAGRGKITSAKGGRLNIKVNEPCYIIGIASITPYVDYSQGNEWDLYLDTMNDLHKPQLDGIGYQDLLQRNMYWKADNDRAIGKQPAWINYMTALNKTKGLFAAGESNSYMVLNRIYNMDATFREIENYTTYINPRDFTYIFATNEIDNQDFWVQLGFGIERRWVGSAKQIPLM